MSPYRTPSPKLTPLELESDDQPFAEVLISSLRCKLEGWLVRFWRVFTLECLSSGCNHPLGPHIFEVEDASYKYDKKNYCPCCIRREFVRQPEVRVFRHTRNT
jgi:hypothetical protein